jgi:hypothetical protein
MTQQYDNEMRGLIGKNDRKEQDSHPDIKGECQIGGTAYWISGWRKERKDGSGSFYSLSFKAKDAPQPAAKPAPKRVAADEDEISF